MNNWNYQTIRYVDMQPTSAPNGSHESAASPDSASSIGRDGTWPSKTINFPILEIPVDGRIMAPTDAPEFKMMQSGA